MRTSSLVLCLGWLVAACTTPEPSVDPAVPMTLPPAGEGAAPAGEDAPPAPLPKGSFYDLGFALTNADARPVGLDVHRGHPTMVAMFYASCTQACPLMIGKVQHILSTLDPDTIAQVRVLLLSIDPEHDTPQALAEAATRHQIDRTRWVLARPEPKDVRTLAALLDVRYRAQGEGGFSHTSPITLLDREGQMVLRQAALTDPEETMVAHIRALTTR